MSRTSSQRLSRRVDSVVTSLARKLTELREKHELTHQQVGDELGVTLWTSMRWCQGKNSPSIPQLVHLAELYGVEPSHLLNGTAAHSS